MHKSKSFDLLLFGCPPSNLRGTFPWRLSFEDPTSSVQLCFRRYYDSPLFKSWYLSAFLFTHTHTHSRLWTAMKILNVQRAIANLAKRPFGFVDKVAPFAHPGKFRCWAVVGSRSWGSGGGKSPFGFRLDFENFSKKDCFLSFEWEKTNFTAFGPLEKFWKNP